MSAVRVHRGCYAPNFFHALQIDQDYLAHTPTGTGFPTRKSKRENVQFGLHSALMGIPSQILIQTTCREPGVKTWYTFWMACPMKFGRAEEFQNLPRFMTTVEFDREYPLNGLTIGISKSR